MRAKRRAASSFSPRSSSSSASASRASAASGPGGARVEGGGQAQEGGALLSALQEDAGALQEEGRGLGGALGGDEGLGARGPQLGQLARLTGLGVEGLQPGGERVVQAAQREGLGVGGDGGLAVSHQLARAAQARADVREALGGGGARQGGQQRLQRAPGVLGALAAQREVRQLQQHGLVRRQARGLLQGHQRLADAAQPGLQHVGQLAQRRGREPLVALRLGHARPLLQGGGQARHVRALALEGAQLAQGGQVVRLRLQHLLEGGGGEVQIEGQVARGHGEAAVLLRALLGLGGEAREGGEAAGEQPTVAAGLGERQHGLQRGLVVGVGLQRGGEEALGLLGLLQAAAVQLAGLGPEGGAAAGLLVDGGGLLQRLGELLGAAGGAEVGNQLVERGEVARVQRERGLQVLAGAGGVAELRAVQARQGVVALVRGLADGLGARRGAGELQRLLVAGERLLQLAQLLGHARGGEEGLGLAGQQRDGLAVAQQRVLRLLEALFPDAAGEEVGAAHAVQLVAGHGHLAQPVQGLEGAQVLAAAVAQLAQQQQRIRLVRREAQRGLAVQAGAGDIVLRLGAQPREVHVGIRGLGGVSGERGDAAVGAHGAGAVPALVRGAREGLEGRQVVRLEAEHLVEGLHRHLGRMVAGGAGGGLGGEEGGGLLGGAARQGAQGEVALGGAGVLAAALAHHGLAPEGGGALLAAAQQRGGHVQGQVVRLRVRHEERQQALGGEGVGVLGVTGLEVRLAGLGELALGEQGLGVGEGAGALEGQQQLLVGRGRRRQATGGEAQTQARAAHLGGGEARGVQHGHLEAPADGGLLAERGQHAGGEAGGAAHLHLGQQAQLGHGGGEEAGHLHRRRGGEAVQAHVVEVEGEPLAIRVEGHLEGERGALRGLEEGLALEVAGAEVQLEALEAGHASGELRHLARHQLRVDVQLQEAEEELLALVARGPGADVEGEGDVGNLQREVGDGQAGRQLAGAETPRRRACPTGAARGRRLALRTRAWGSRCRWPSRGLQWSTGRYHVA